MEEREMHKAKCSDCGQECEVPFEPTEGKPVRCNDCFRKNKPRRFDSPRRFDNRRSSSSDRQPREMHKAKCGDCGHECQVPFRPTEGKPVYCQDCFAKRRN